MTSLRPNFSAPSHSAALRAPDVQGLTEPGRPPRTLSLMRKYEAAALLADLTISFNQHVAPATHVFEETASAFARGTLIATVRGPVAIEDLLPGDYIETALGAEPVVWIGSTNFVPGHDDEKTSLRRLTRITADAFGLGRPSMDLLVGPAARMAVRHERLQDLLGLDAVLAPVEDYADGDRFLEITPGGTVQLYHLMTRRHTTFKVGGVEMETYHPGKSVGQVLGHNMRALFLSMFPNIQNLEDFGQTCLTRTTRTVVEGVLGN